MNYQLENNEQVRKLESELGSMRERLSVVSQQLENNGKELTREKAKNKSVSKHVEVSLGIEFIFLAMKDFQAPSPSIF